MIKRTILLLILCPLCFLSGCTRRHTLNDADSYLRLVVRVDVVGNTGSNILEKTYTHQEKIEAILNYLRLIKQRGPADSDPEQFLGESYTITLHLSDGSKQVYRQHANRFLSKDSRPWRNIDPEHAGFLYPLLQAMPSDYA